jgi:hypothetical protein
MDGPEGVLESDGRYAAMLGIGRVKLACGIGGILALVASTMAVTLTIADRPATASAAGQTVSPAAVDGVVAAPVGYNTARTLGTAAQASPAAAYPVWCCSGGNPLGLTVIGQGTAHGTSASARQSAIARAVTDARSQAAAAAKAAGVSLGRIINLQVSVPYYPYPLPMGAAMGSSGRGTAPSSANQPTVTCPVGAVPACPDASVSATVTVTWAIG